jgi:hypothetical protein
MVIDPRIFRDSVITLRWRPGLADKRAGVIKGTGTKGVNTESEQEGAKSADLLARGP